MQTILNFAPGILSSSLPQASRVDPVVITSSISIKCLLWSDSFCKTLKIVPTTSLRPKKVFLVWVLEYTFRINTESL